MESKTSEIYFSLEKAKINKWAGDFPVESYSISCLTGATIEEDNIIVLFYKSKFPGSQHILSLHKLEKYFSR